MTVLCSFYEHRLSSAVPAFLRLIGMRHFNTNVSSQTKPGRNHWTIWNWKAQQLDSSPEEVSAFNHYIFYLAPAAAAKSLQSYRTLCDPIDGSPLSLGFSRQEHWSGLPFPSPMHGSEKWKWSHSVVSDSSRLHGLQPTRLLHPWNFRGKSTGVGCHSLLWHNS